MEYRITLGSHPKVAIIGVLVVGLPSAGILSFFFLPALVGIIITVIGTYFAYQLGKFMANTLRARILTGEEGMTFILSAKETPFIAWSEITNSGLCRQGKKRTAYIYKEEGDRLLTFPDEFSGFDRLLNELRSRVEVEVEEVDLADTDTIKDHLRRKLGLPEQDEEGEEEEETKVPDDDSEIEDSESGEQERGDDN